MSLCPGAQNFVQTKVMCGRYSSASEVGREVLRLIEDHDRHALLSLRSSVPKSIVV
jgi:putative addiction module CopG family antidote